MSVDIPLLQKGGSWRFHRERGKRLTYPTFTYSDIVIAYRKGSKFTAHNYHVSSYQSCSFGRGVCLDADHFLHMGTDDLTTIASSRKADLTSIRYTCPLVATNTAIDKPLLLTRPSYIVWVLGILLPRTDYPFFDDTVYLSKLPTFDFGCPVESRCKATPGNDTPSKGDEKSSQCTVPFKGGLKMFSGCKKTLSGGLRCTGTSERT